jgi:polysaccharide pyruvyl transferase WcaK-like protein
MSMQRRSFLASAITGLAAGWASAGRAKPRILLRSSWQVVNIGDIAHTPGVLALIEKHVPEAEVTLWASRDLSEPVMAMEHKRFPKLVIVKGTIGKDGKASNPELQTALDQCDFLLHGSGPSLVAEKDVTAFAEHYRKPYGVYGITYSGVAPEIRPTFTKAKFLFFRDTVSLAKAKDDGISSPIMEFGPDGAFACDVRDDARATAFLKEHRLEEGRFLCCITRFRNTPYWKIRGTKMTEIDMKKHAENEKWKEHDAAPLRESILAVLKETPMKILVCPEDASQMAINKEMLIDKLPATTKDRVVWRENFWLTDEALSTYIRSAGMFGHEMHSPIMCIGQGIPAIVCRWNQQTSKGFMWRDIGLGDWLFDFEDESTLAKVAPAVLALAKDPAAARKKATEARARVEARQRETMAIVRRHLG